MSAVIYVQPDDDVRSVLARMEQAKGETIGIVVPASSTSVVGPVSLRLLRRQAEALGLDLGLVTQLPSLRDQARAEGIPVYRSPSAYERAVRRRAAAAGSQLESESSSAGTSWATIAAVSVIVLLIAGAAIAFVPEMDVVVSPSTATLSQTIRVAADPALASVDVDRQRIPARRVQVVATAVDQALPGEGEPAGDGRARGLVTFTNRTQDSLQITAGTYLSTPDGVRFATEQSLSVPGGIGQTGKAYVVAVVPGEQGNVSRLRVNMVPSALDAKVYVQNEESMAGGGVPGSRIVTAVDHDRLLKRVSDKARAVSEAEMKAALGVGDQLISQSIRFTPMETVFDGDVGEEAGTLGVRFRAEVSGLVVSSSDLERIGRETWTPQAPPGFEVVAGSIKTGPSEVVGVEGQSVVLSLRLQATSRALLDVVQMEQLARWRSAPDASRLLARAFDLSRPPQVSFTPGWARWAYRVHVTVGVSPSLADK